MKENQGNGAIPAPPEGFTFSTSQKRFRLPVWFRAGQTGWPTEKAGGFGGIASEVGKMLYDLPTQAAGIWRCGDKEAYEGAEPYTNTDWADELVQKARTRHQERLAEPYADQPLPFGLTRKDFRDTGASPGSLAYLLFLVLPQAFRLVSRQPLQLAMPRVEPHPALPPIEWQATLLSAR